MKNDEVSKMLYWETVRIKCATHLWNTRNFQTVKSNVCRLAIVIETPPPTVHSFVSVDNPMKVECATSASLCMTCNFYLLVGLHFRLITKQKRSSSFVVLFRPFLFPLSLFFTVWFDLFSYSVARIPLENKRFVASATAWLPFDSYDFFFLR